ncbi:MAG: hypothetical protein M1828_001419 [Chrysothrix sp. TS-e1954]|nr:MAG: hypothetical protein M1828_001419 [Chrysothrix sp. TS-e1954]
MVSLDCSRDYYADLELPPDASSDDIRKQYRKLALKFHPDRNLGKELECSHRFQAVQAASEILGDPVQRTKYDTSRKRGNVNTGSFARPTPPRRRPDPFPTATNYPPPPRRTQPRPTSNVPPPTSNGGAQRYTRFSQPGPPPPQPSAKQDAKERANMFDAWQSMNHAQKAQAQRKQGYAVPPPYTGPRFTNESDADAMRSKAADPPTPRSAYDEVNRPRPGGPTRTASSRFPPRAGFDPTRPPYDPSPMGGSYPPGANRQYDRAPNAPRSNGFSPQPPSRGQAPTAKRPEPADHSRSKSGEVPFPEGLRERTPYISHVGEKTYFNTDSLKRSESVRDASKMPTQSDQWGRRKSVQETAKQHSSSPPSRAAAEDNHSTSPVQQASQVSPSHAKANTASQSREKPRPFVINSSGEEDSSSEPSLDTESSAGPSRRPSVQGNETFGAGEASSPYDQNAVNRPKAQPSRSRTERKTPASPLGKSKSLESKAAWRQRAYQSGTKVQQDSSIFDFPKTHDSFARTSHPNLRSPGLSDNESPFRRSSHSGLDPSTHDPEDRSGYFNLDGDRPPHSAPGPMPSSAQATTSPMSKTATQPPPSSAGNGTFRADHWSNNFRDQNWDSVWAPPAKLGTSPTRPNSSNTRRQRVPKQNSNPFSASVADVEEEEAGLAGTFNGDNDAHARPRRDSNAMDIDPEPPSASNRSSSSPSKPRPIFVEPERPDWRDGLSSEGNRASVQSSKSEALLPAPNTRHTQLSMSDFRHVAPLTDGTSGGIKNMSDLSASLPFNSQPSSTHPKRLNSDPEPFRANIGKAPRIPTPPQTYTDTTWNYYVGQMTTYVKAWNEFNSRVVSYLQDRAVQQAEMEKGPNGGVLSIWLGVDSEAGALGGWENYCAGLKDDERVRVYWSSACEKHMEALERHGRMREEVKMNMSRG